MKYPALPSPPLHPPFLGSPPGTPQEVRRTHPLQTVAPRTGSSLPARRMAATKAEEEREATSTLHLKNMRML
jgi:hypothetical protein